MKIARFSVPILLLLLTVSCNGQSKQYLFNTEGKQIKSNNNDVIVIDKIIDLAGETMKLPACSKVVFEGNGSIRNGRVLVDLKTNCIEGGRGIFYNIELLPCNKVNNIIKSPLKEIDARWFGVLSDENYDNTSSIQRAIDAGHAFAIPVLIPRGYYCINNTLKLYDGDVLKGEYSGRITPNHQTGATFIRYKGKGKEILSVEGKYVTIENLLIAASTPYVVDGISLKGNAGLYFSLCNVLLVNTNRGICCTLGEGMGLSGCIFEKVSLWKCVRAFSFDMDEKAFGQYITYNNFYNVIVSNVKEIGAYFHCRAINSCVFRDCMFETIGYDAAYDKQYEKTDISAIYAKNEAQQGSIIIEGGYFENIYYSVGGEPSVSRDDSFNSIFFVDNISLTVRNARFANTRTVVKSVGLDNVYINNCIDNGYYRKKLKNEVVLCYGTNNTVLEIDGYSILNQNKKPSSLIGSNEALNKQTIKNYRRN